MTRLAQFGVFNRHKYVTQEYFLQQLSYYKSASPWYLFLNIWLKNFLLITQADALVSQPISTSWLR